MSSFLTGAGVVLIGVACGLVLGALVVGIAWAVELIRWMLRG